MKFKPEIFENVYEMYNKKEFIHPDPLEFLFKYKKNKDIEIVALIASSLAYGRVNRILISVSLILDSMDTPSNYLKTKTYEDFLEDFKDFKHRFTTGVEMADFLYGIKKSIEKFGTLEKTFLNYYNESDLTIVPALKGFTDFIKKDYKQGKSSLLPDPAKGSSCKRLALFMRWMVRNDDVDQGFWKIPLSKLIIPLDTHMHKMSITFGLTQRKQADMKTVLEITENFKKINPKDPVKYDFSLTRPGIYEGETPEFLLKKLNLI
jgi:uncharacterized protein (TIGR02757 family)